MASGVVEVDPDVERTVNRRVGKCVGAVRPIDIDTDRARCRRGFDVAIVPAARLSRGIPRARRILNGDAARRVSLRLLRRWMCAGCLRCRGSALPAPPARGKECGRNGGSCKYIEAFQRTLHPVDLLRLRMRLPDGIVNVPNGAGQRDPEPKPRTVASSSPAFLGDIECDHRSPMHRSAYP